MRVGYMGADLTAAVEELEQAAAPRERVSQGEQLTEIKSYCQEERKVLMRQLQAAEKKTARANERYEKWKAAYWQLAKQEIDATFESQRRIRELQTQGAANEALKTPRICMENCAISE
jgi:SpoVK/Ycf46/Vps4 family AAA+-type ATPase